MRALLIALLLFATPALAQDFDATVEWDYPVGFSQPDGYRLYVSRDGSAYSLEQEGVQSGVTLTAPSGQVVSVQVSAVLGETESERSVASEPVTFIRLGVPTGVRVLIQVN